MQQEMLLQDPPVSLAGSEITISGWRYDLGAVRSVDVMREPAAATGPILMTLVGMLCLFSVVGRAGATGAIVGAGLLAGAAAWWIRKRPTFKVCLRTDAGAATAFESRDEADATRVMAAIREALSRQSA